MSPPNCFLLIVMSSAEWVLRFLLFKSYCKPLPLSPPKQIYDDALSMWRALRARAYVNAPSIQIGFWFFWLNINRSITSKLHIPLAEKLSNELNGAFTFFKICRKFRISTIENYATRLYKTWKYLRNGCSPKI